MFAQFLKYTFELELGTELCRSRALPYDWVMFAWVMFALLHKEVVQL